MWRLIALTLAAFIVGSCSWQVGAQLSNDSVAMILGLLFGILASVPIRLLAMANNRIIAQREADERRRQLMEHPEAYRPMTRPVIWQEIDGE